MTKSRLAEALSNSQALLDGWLEEQLSQMTDDGDVDARRLREESMELLRLLSRTVADNDDLDVELDHFEDVRRAVSRLTTMRARQGFEARDNAVFMFALKRPLFRALRALYGDASDALFDDLWRATQLVDGLGLVAVEAQAQVADRVIARQRSELLEVSTPVLQLWERVLVMPLIGTLDSHRAKMATETLLEAVVKNNSKLVLLDIQGVPTVDTLVAQHLVKTVKALRLMGAEGIVSGIGPQIAQTMVQLGIELGSIETTFTLAGGLERAFYRMGLLVQQRPEASPFAAARMA